MSSERKLVSDYLRQGTAEYRRAVVGLFCAGFSSFALLYCMQPLLPLLSRTFAVGPAGSSLAVSAATVGVAVSLLAVGAMSDRLGRKSLMAVSMFAVSLLTLGAAAAPNWPSLLVMRFLSGVALSGVPAVAMAYLAEEIEPAGLGSAMGLSIGGNAIGGMTGRLLTAALADVTGSWRLAVAAMGVLGLASALIFLRVLPPSRRFKPAPRTRARQYLQDVGGLFATPGLPWLFAVGFLQMGVFVSLFNTVGFRLVAAPFRLSSAAVGAIFLVYLLGAPASAAFGRAGDRFGRPPVLIFGVGLMLAGLGLTLPDNLVAIVLGLALAAAAYFGVHAMAGTWVNAQAPHARGKASALYLLFVYMGPSLAGATAGRLWSERGWPGVVALLASMAAATLAIVVASPLRRGEKTTA